MKRDVRTTERAAAAAVEEREPASPAADRDDYLHRLGERVREERTRRGMTRRILARDSRLSERYLAQLEAGKGNISINLLRQVADALNMPLTALVGDEPDLPVDMRLILE